MPKSLYIDPEKTLHPKEHVIKIPDIPVMTYDKTVKQELKEGNFTEEDLLRIYRDMSYIREFETIMECLTITLGLPTFPQGRRQRPLAWPTPWTPTTSYSEAIALMAKSWRKVFVRFRFSQMRN